MEWPNTNHGVFAISVAAELAGLHPQTLRIYEREGLLEPARSSGGTRRYSGEDVERLRLIADLTTAGLNLAGVKRVLALEAELDAMRATIERLDGELQRERNAKPRR
jgi:MerR family transcriptional regulator, heat shock protein HspR